MSEIIRTTVHNVTYFDARCTVTIEHHDKAKFGDRTITHHWLDKADARNGGHEAGTKVRKRVTGDGQRVPGSKGALVVITEPEVVPA